MALSGNYQNLANAIVIQAVKDYRKAMRRLRKDPKHEKSLFWKKYIERFFRSQWFEDLCDLDGEVLIEQLQKEAELK